MASKKDATEAAQRRAEEEGVNLSKVEGSGQGGTVTVSDVEEAAQEPEKMFEVKLNPRLPSFQLLTSVTAFGRVFSGGEVLSESEYERYKEAESAEGIQLLIKGQEVS